MNYSIVRFPACTACILALALLSWTGCGSRVQGIPQYAVHGKVVSKGQPAAGAIVALHPKDKAAAALPYAPRGIVDKDGSFVIGSRTKDDGAPEGDYAVTIIWPKDEDPQKQFDNTPPDRLKNRYNDPKHTKWNVHVAAGANTLETFNVE